MRWKRALGVFGLLVLSRAPLPASLLPGPHLAERTAAADLIVVAKVTGGSSFASGPNVVYNLVLHVDRVLKGEAAPGTDVSAHLEGRGYFDHPAPVQGAASPFYGIWFLDTSVRPFRVIPREGGFAELWWVPVRLPEEAPPGEPAATPAGRVANEIGAAIQVLALNETELSRSGDYHELADGLRSLPPEARRPVFAGMADAALLRVRADGIAGLIGANDPRGVLRADAEWDALVAGGQAGQFGQGVIGALMTFNDASDAAAVRALADLAMHEPTQPQLREMASWSLRAIHTRETLPALAALLDHNYVGVRHMAISGFCLFVLEAPVVDPTSDQITSYKPVEDARFATPETQAHCQSGGAIDAQADLDAYAAFWKAWWAAHRAAIQAQ